MLHEAAAEVRDDLIGGIHWLKHLVFGEFDEDRPLSVVVTTMMVSFVPGTVIIISARDLTAVTVRLAKHPEKREQIAEWILLIACIVPLVLPILAAAVGAVAAGVGAIIGGIAGSAAGATLRMVCLTLISKNAPLLEVVVARLRPFIKGDILKVLSDIKFVRYQEAIGKFFGEFVEKLIRILKDTRVQFEKLPRFEAVSELSAKLKRLETAFYDLQRSALKWIPLALAELDSRLQQLLGQFLPHNPRPAMTGIPAPMAISMEARAKPPGSDPAGEGKPPAKRGRKTGGSAPKSARVPKMPEQMSQAEIDALSYEDLKSLYRAEGLDSEAIRNLAQQKGSVPYQKLQRMQPPVPANIDTMTSKELREFLDSHGFAGAHEELPAPYADLLENKVQDEIVALWEQRAIEREERARQQGISVRELMERERAAYAAAHPVQPLGNVPYGPAKTTGGELSEAAARQVAPGPNLHPETLPKVGTFVVDPTPKRLQTLINVAGLGPKERLALLKGETVEVSVPSKAPANMLEYEEKARRYVIKDGALHATTIDPSGTGVQLFIARSHVVAQSLGVEKLELFASQVDKSNGWTYHSAQSALTEHGFKRLNIPNQPVGYEIDRWQLSTTPFAVKSFESSATGPTEYYFHLTDRSFLKSIGTDGLAPGQVLGTGSGQPWVNVLFGTNDVKQNILNDAMFGIAGGDFGHIKDPVVIKIPYEVLEKGLGFRVEEGTASGLYVPASVIREHNPDLFPKKK